MELLLRPARSAPLRPERPAGRIPRLCPFRSHPSPSEFPLMKKWQKRTGIGLGSIVLALVLGVLVVYAASEVRFRRAYDEVAVSPFRAASDPAALERGKHLATAVGKCVECHAADMGGKVFMDAGPLGTVVASNLTTGRGGVLARYGDGQLERAIRHGISADGHALAIMPSAEYNAMS